MFSEDEGVYEDMSEQKTLILIDGHALAFRQYYALERSNMKTTDGIPSWAVYGFFKAIFDLLKNKDLHPDAITVAFDVSHQTFRVDKYPEYKANRSAMPDPMKIQMDLIYEGLKAFNIPIYTKEGYEADDVIGTISKEACALGHKVLILTGDQDAFQLVDKEGCTKVILPTKGELVEYDWQKIYEKLGVYPSQVVDYKALRGDASDNIPGVKGIGEKTAQRLLEKYENLENILNDCEDIPEKAVKEKICSGKEIAELSKFLAKIVTDVDITFDFEGTRIELPNITEVTAFLRKMQFYSFLKNINTILTSFDKGFVPSVQNETASIEVPQSNNGQLSFFTEAVKAEVNKVDLPYDKKLITDSQDLDELVKELEKQSLIAFKLEALINSAVDSYIVGIALAYNPDFTSGDVVEISNENSRTKSFYIPLGHSSGNQLGYKDVLPKIKPIFENKNIKKTTYNAKIEYNILRNLGINAEGIIFDVLLASYVKDPNANHELDIQSLEHLDHIISEFAPYEPSRKKRIQFNDAVIENAFNFATDEAASVFELTRYWLTELDERELNLLYKLEIPMSLVLADMEFTGISVDVNYLKKFSDTMDGSLHRLERKIYDIAGQGFNLNSPRQVGEILYDKLQIKTPRKRGKAKFSTSAEVLEELAKEYEIAQLLLEYRKYSKLKSTYTDALPGLISPVDGRIHTTYNQTVTATGRLSSSNPNLQNIPIRTEEGNKIRTAFIAKEKDNLILSADYSQIELRLLADITGDKNLINAFKTNTDVHTLTASNVFDVPISEVTKDMRYKSKAVNFGIIYGQTKYGLAKAISITPDEAEIFIDKYFLTYPGVKEYMQKTIEEAEKNGYVESAYGRKRYLSTELSSPNSMIREFAKRAATNHPMQGTAADMIKVAMIELSNKLKENNLKSKLIMQVHDELVIEVDKDEVDVVQKLVKEAMELGQPLKVPLVVDVSVGKSWKE